MAKDRGYNITEMVLPRNVYIGIEQVPITGQLRVDVYEKIGQTDNDDVQHIHEKGHFFLKTYKSDHGVKPTLENIVAEVKKILKKR